MTEDEPTAPLQRANAKFAPRIAAKTKQALEIMAAEGATPEVASERVGMTRNALVRAMKRPHVKSFYLQRVADIRNNAAQSAYLRINHIAQTAESKRLSFDASRWVAGVDGLAPVQRVEGKHQHEHSFGGFEVRTDDALDVTPPDSQSGAIEDESQE